MFTADTYTPTRVLFGPGRLDQLAKVQLPGAKALLCVTADGLMDKLGIQGRVVELLKQNGVESAVFDGVEPNPTRAGVMAAVKLAKESGCDFVIGLGGGSSIDTAKAVAILLKNPGDLWDYAGVGTGGRKEVTGAAPVVAITTTAGTGTETDPYAVITNEETGEKIDFTLDAIFPALSIIDPELTLTLPRNLTLYQGFDALFHAAECYISNENDNRLVCLYARDAIETVAKWLPVAAEDGSNLEARTHIAYAADILCGYTQSIINTTSHHIIAQTIGGMFPAVPHGLSLLMIAEAYYKRVQRHRPALLDEIGAFMGVRPDAAKPGHGFSTALHNLMEQTGMPGCTMADYGIQPGQFPNIARVTVEVVGIGFEKYSITQQDIIQILRESIQR